MPSPFPGMNPYLEQDDVWPDFHQSLLPLVRERLNEQVRPAYIVTLEEHRFVHAPPADGPRPPGRADRAAADSGTTGSVGVGGHSYLAIRDRRSREPITVIELLDPATKRPGPDHEHYLARRRRSLSCGVNVVELDLLRGGPRLPLEDVEACDYHALISRSEGGPGVEVWPILLRDPLPNLPIPLRAPDPDVRLDLQEVLHRLYDAAGYEDYIYTVTPQPPLDPDTDAWAQRFIPASG